VTASALSASALSAGYGLGAAAAPPVLAGIDFELPAGECLAVVGRSGCGKSTLLNVLAGVHPPAGGRVRAGEETVAAGDWRQTDSPGCTSGHAAYLFQQDLLLPWKGALANAVFAARVAAGGAARHERRDLEDRAAGLLREFGLGDNLDSLPRELSGGMRQRVALARTVLMDRGVILLDEPFGSLDAVTRAEMRLWLLDVMAAHPATWVLVTHDVDEAVLLGDQVAVLRGRPARLEGWATTTLSRARRRRIAAVAAGVPETLGGEPAGAEDGPVGAAVELPEVASGSRTDPEVVASAATGLRRALLDERWAS
jgi:ABC-type nitrate/sulfonate/bicarbonate transport system ATPase subunit